MTDLVLTRLNPDDPTGWAYWPILERRVRAAIPLLEPDASPDAVIRHLRTLWATQPARLGAWLALREVARTNGHTPAPLVIAHMVAWVDIYWGEACIMVYQLEGEPGEGALALLQPMMRELEAWRETLNRIYETANSSQRINLVRFYTTRPGAYARWFKPVVEVRAGGTIVSFRLSDVMVPSQEI